MEKGVNQKRISSMKLLPRSRDAAPKDPHEVIYPSWGFLLTDRV